MINLKSLVVMLILISIFVVAVSGCASNTKPVANTNLAATKLAFTNNGPTWVHVDAVIENMRMKYGTYENFYIDTYIKPGSNVKMDLSSLAGYGNQPLPSGTKIKLLAWDGLYNH